MIVATKELKCHFEKFCENEFPGKKYCSNLDNRKGWFYVQAGNKFGELLHYEYNGGFISLHITTWTVNQIYYYVFFSVSFFIVTLLH